LREIADRKSKEDKARQEAVAKAEKGRQDSVARADKARQDSLKLVAARNAQEEKARQETLAKAAAKARQDSLAKVAEVKAKTDKAKQDSLARVAEANAKAVKAKQDSLARVAEANAKAAKAKQDSLVRVAEANAKAEKAKQDSLARVAEARVKAEKARQDSLARVAEAKSKADKARQDSLARVAVAKAKAEKATQDSLARVAEAKAKAEKAKQDSLARVAEVKAKLEKAKQDSLARVAEAKAKSEKARQDSLARVEKARQERERLARERKDRFDRAYSLYRAGRMDSASILFKTVLADSPVADAWYYAGRVRLAQGDFPGALDLFSRSPADKPDLEGLKGRALLGMGKPKEALKPLEAQYAKDKNDSLLEDIIAAKRRLGDEAGAIASLETLASAVPAFSSSRSNSRPIGEPKGTAPRPRKGMTASLRSIRRTARRTIGSASRRPKPGTMPALSAGSSAPWPRIRIAPTPGNPWPRPNSPWDGRMPPGIRTGRHWPSRPMIRSWPRDDCYWPANPIPTN